MTDALNRNRICNMLTLKMKRCAFFTSTICILFGVLGIGCAVSSSNQSYRTSQNESRISVAQTITVNDLIGAVVGQSVVNHISIIHLPTIAGSLPIPFNEGEIVWSLRIAVLPDEGSGRPKHFWCFLSTTREILPKEFFMALFGFDKPELINCRIDCLSCVIAESVDNENNWSTWKRLNSWHVCPNSFETAKPIWSAEAIVEMEFEGERLVVRYRDAAEVLKNWRIGSLEFLSSDECVNDGCFKNDSL